MMLDICNATAKNLGVSDVDMSTEASSTDSIKTIAAANSKVSVFRSRFGAQQNRLEKAYRMNDIAMEKTQEAESSIRDTDMFKMITEFYLADTVRRTGQNMLTKANLEPEWVLQLLK